MKINEMPATMFEDVNLGEVFYSYDEEKFYMRIENTEEGNAVCLSSGEVFHCFPSEEVRVYPNASLNLE